MSGVAAIAVSITAGSTANAGHGFWGASHGSSGGSSGSFGSSGGASYGSSGGSHGSSGGSYGSSGGSSGGFASSGGSSGHVGPVRRLFQRMHEHHAAKVAARRAYGSSGGSYGSSGGSYGSSGGSYGSSGGASYGSSGGSYGSSGGSYSSASVHYAPVVDEYDSVPVYGGESKATDVPKTEVEASIEGDMGILTVAVPEDAVVTVNGLPTKSEGPIRQFMSNGLEAGYVYKYVVEVSYPGIAKPETRTVRLRAGAAERLVFNRPAGNTVAEAAAEHPETVVTVRVPADATVTLAGNDTNGSGETRTFRTRRLAAGESWSDYTIRVTAMVNGSAISQERSLELVAGSAHELDFDFDSTDVASR
ncbi:MAG: TIGR03000 domain-containing protein [Planctomycetaceae bacterium]|nr:MAG: TIGR03000 domain-containing protein [Planctomycetaceae bacterium]